ncbi:hypothetical protein AAFC00_003293 [Neodothiora populina]|uniref:Succinate dehydrogenase subunit C n=1 Tax=Neodothiora populina TaxID=2781224 RepID=A0ABR3PB89_9PEZI
MLAQRIAQQSLRRLAVARQPALVSTGIINQKRLAATQHMPEDEASRQILAKQRLHRPVAPHLTIYKPQITWILSSLNRITGITLSAPLYLFSLAYLAAPAFGWHLESASIAAAFGAWPVAAKFLTKFIIAMPFTFHSFNGLRHLAWDVTVGITNKQVQITGWSVVALTTLSSALLAFL